MEGQPSIFHLKKRNEKRIANKTKNPEGSALGTRQRWILRPGKKIKGLRA